MADPSLPWPVRHFTQANPAGDDQHDVPALLRQVADRLEGLGPVEVEDVVFHRDLDADGDEPPSMTVSFSPTTTFEDVRGLFDRFFRDAATVGVHFAVEDGGADAGGIFVRVRTAEGMADGFSFDRQGRGDHVVRVLDCFDVLQESVHEVLARRGRFGPWPPCPVDGHAHRLTTAWEPETSSGWWACPTGDRVVPIGGLPVP